MCIEHVDNTHFSLAHSKWFFLSLSVKLFKSLFAIGQAWVKKESGVGWRLTACLKGLLPTRYKLVCYNKHAWIQAVGTPRWGIASPYWVWGQETQGNWEEKLLCSQLCHCQTARKTTTAAGKPRQPSPTRRARRVLPAPSLSAASVTPTLHLEETPSLPPTPSPPPVSQSPASTGGPRACATGNVQSFPLACREGLRASWTRAACLVAGQVGHRRTPLCPHLANSRLALSPTSEPSQGGLTAGMGWFRDTWVPPSGCRGSMQATGSLHHSGLYSDPEQ